MADDVETTETPKDGVKPDDLGEAGKRALDAERKARAAAEKRAKELEAKVKEAEDAEKTELEKLQSHVAELTKDTEAAVSRADRYEVAASKGLTLAQARRLVGATKDELEADADAMAEELGLKKGDDKPTDDVEETETGPELGGKSTEGKPLSRPKEDLKGGASNEGGTEPDPAKLAESILSKSW